MNISELFSRLTGAVILEETRDSKRQQVLPPQQFELLRVERPSEHIGEVVCICVQNGEYLEKELSALALLELITAEHYEYEYNDTWLSLIQSMHGNNTSDGVQSYMKSYTKI